MNRMILILLAVTTLASPAEVSIVAKAIYGNIAAVSTNKRDALILLNPSVPLEWPSSQPKNLEQSIKAMADSLPEPRWILNPKKDSVRTIYLYIAANATFAKTADDGPPADQLTPEETDLLFKNGDRSQPSEAYQKYLDLNQRVANASASIKKESDPQKRAALDLERSQAALQLSALPHLDEIRSASRKLSASETRPSTFSRARLQKILAAYKGPQFTPPIDKWNDGSGWVRIETTVNTSFDSPIFAVGPSASADSWWEPTTADGLFGRRASKIAFEIKRVLVDRGSLDLSLFEAKNWRLSDDTLISDGQALTAGVAMKGKMPLIITGLLLCRNVVVTTPMSSDAQSAALAASNADGFAFGPILLGGRYLAPTTGDRFYPSLGVRGITTPEIEILAVVSSQVPLSPNPDPNLKW